MNEEQCVQIAVEILEAGGLFVSTKWSWTL